MLTATDEFEFQAEAENRIRNLMLDSERGLCA